jgi:hypothetical protein
MTERKSETRKLEATNELSDVKTLTLIPSKYNFVSLQCYLHALNVSYTAARKIQDSALTGDGEQFDS